MKIRWSAAASGCEIRTSGGPSPFVITLVPSSTRSAGPPPNSASVRKLPRTSVRSSRIRDGREAASGLAIGSCRISVNGTRFGLRTVTVQSRSVRFAPAHPKNAR